ncbi:MAG TPA: BlaI/MecI/CopY family transcriptional regulator [Verrucomicrobiae bacterium]|nr:BlaI/MecI/CopY family transcriptional regulator [Verrucomicrobiae bacterium]
MQSKGKNRPVPPITAAEWVVMRTLWSKAPQSTNEVVTGLEDRAEWKPKTIHTLLARLVQKKALRAEKRGREYVYSPLVRAEECEYEISRSFLGRFFDGELAPFLSRLVEREKLTRQEIEELKRILDEGAK